MPTYFSSKVYQYPNSHKTSVVNWIVGITIGVFLLQHIFGLWWGSQWVDLTFSLSPFSVGSGYFWTFITYAFLHANFWHLFLNILFFYFIGKDLEKVIGRLKLVVIYLVSAVVAGIAWYILNAYKLSFLIGASGAVLGAFCYYCCLHPNQPMTFLFFFLIPITLKPKVLLWLIIIYEFMSLVMSGPPGSQIIANAAHLGGILGGALCFLVFNKLTLIKIYPNKKIPKHAYKYTINLSNHAEIKEHLDQILDKINKHGFGSLTIEEKAFLDESRDFFK